MLPLITFYYRFGDYWPTHQRADRPILVDMRGMLAGGREWDGWVWVMTATLVAGVAATSSVIWLPEGWAALVTAGSAVVAGAVTAEGMDRRGTAVAAAAGRQHLLCLDSKGRLPVVAGMDPVELGVHPAASGPGLPPGLPVFIRRDVSTSVEERLSPGHFVLLVGESTAGKTRTAYEAMAARAGRRLLIVPNGAEGIMAAVEVAGRLRRSAVIWLDDLEKFLGSGGLSRTDVQNLLHAGRRQHIILATLRAEEYAQLTGERGTIGPPGPGYRADPQRRGEDVLRMAEHIQLPRSWSRQERDRALDEAYADDPRIREALLHIDIFGLAEYLAAGPHLLQACNIAWAVGNHPRGAALVEAAILARRCGIHRPLPATVLAGIAHPILTEHGGIRLHPEPLEQALQWATTPVHATSSPLIPHDDERYTAFDYLVDALPKQPPPAEAFDALLAFATDDEPIGLAELAWFWCRFAATHAAWQRALHHPRHERRIYALSGLAELLAEWRGDDQARAFLTSLAQERTAHLGAEHLETLDARLELASWTGWGIDVLKGIQQAEALLTPLRDTGATGATQLLRCRGLIASLRGHLGQWDAVEPELSRLTQDWADRADDDPSNALDSLLRYAYCLSRLNRGEEHISLLRNLLDDPRFTGRRERERTSNTLAYALKEAGKYQEAADLYRERLAATDERYGPADGRTLAMAYELASCLGHLGDTAQAVRILKEVVSAQEAISDKTGVAWVTLKSRLYTWIGMAGDPCAAARGLHNLTEQSTRTLGEHAYATLTCRSRAAHWTAAAGNVEEGLQELALVLADLTPRFGIDDQETRACQTSLTHWRQQTQSATPRTP
ncbi:hypothetical protein [Streptomyces sp. NPDC058954]|uniref:hypothetical protein n=1 Tax=Streptomyces sp. NPDC058954 TaxID=3346677 RepID=UPI0036D13976